jgi:hypothetical protein
LEQQNDNNSLERILKKPDKQISEMEKLQSRKEKEVLTSKISKKVNDFQTSNETR